MSCSITYNPPSVEQQRRRRATNSDGRESCPEIDDSTCIMFARVSADSVYGKKRKRTTTVRRWEIERRVFICR